MPKIDMLDMSGKKTGQIELDDSVFNVPINEYVVTDCIVAELANRRQGNHATLTRAMVAGGGRKPWRQKGTGRARIGSTRAPHWRHGGVAHGPQPRSYEQKVPRQIKRLAYRVVLSDKLNEGRFLVIDGLALNEIKTTRMVDFLAKVAPAAGVGDRKRLIITRDVDENVWKSARNIPGVEVIPTNNISVFELVRADRVIMSREAVEKVQEVLRK